MSEQESNTHRGTASRFDGTTAAVLFALLAAFSITIGDYSLIAARIISCAVFLVTALYLTSGFRQPLRWNLVVLCPLAMALYGLAQTRWSDSKILYNGLDKSLFWFTAAALALLATRVFWNWKAAARIRIAIALFGSFEALLCVLQQASHTGSYFWLFPSGFPDVYGTFAYYNNFAQLIELTFPITLWEALRHREVRFAYLPLAALQVGAVVASTSRAGTGLILIELIAVLFLAWRRGRNSVSLPVVCLAILLSGGFTLMTGYRQVIQKLERPDQLSNRRLINQSSLSMIRQRPLTGWGLGAYVPVYRMFALYDDGTWVNQAHNDYLEWAAEGGIPYALLMVILMGWSIRPATRSIWGLGLLAFALHALVDYPFARLGTCGWYFALAAMLASQGAEDPDAHRRKRKRRHAAEQPQPQPELAAVSASELA